MPMHHKTHHIFGIKLSRACRRCGLPLATTGAGKNTGGFMIDRGGFLSFPPPVISCRCGAGFPGPANETHAPMPWDNR